MEEKKNENEFLHKRIKEKETTMHDIKEELMDFSLKLTGLEEEIKEKDLKLEDLQKENAKLKSENHEITEREANLRKFQGQYKILLARQEAEKTRVLKEIEGLKKGNEEKERTIYAEVLNLKLEKKSLFGKIGRYEQEIEKIKGFFNYFI